MTWTLRRSDQAIDDLADIWTHIATDNPRAADRVVFDLADLFETTARHPEIGRAAPEIGEGVRLLSKGSYLLIYRLIPPQSVIDLIRVVHGARDWRALFEG